MNAKQALADQRVIDGTHAVEFHGVIGWWQILKGPTCMIDRLWVRRDGTWTSIARADDLENPELERSHARVIPLASVHDQSSPLSRGDLPRPG